MLKEYIARGTYIYPPKPSMRIVTDLFAWAAEHTPRWNVISISGYHMREAGCTAVQEVAFTLADACAYIDAALAAGLAIDEFAPQLSFFLRRPRLSRRNRQVSRRAPALCATDAGALRRAQ
ncbi:MAG: methylmalonyl-CoA mutase family protein [Bryobacterales bacterium]